MSPSAIHAAIDAQRDFWNAWADDYQSHAAIDCNDFHYGPLLPGEAHLRLIPRPLAGIQALEVGCGAGHNSIWLGKHDARCTALDISEAQIHHGRRLATREGVSVQWITAPMETIDRRSMGSFDLVHSVHALQFARTPLTALRRICRLLRPGGTLLIATQHPLLFGDWIELEDEGRVLALTHYFHPPDDTRNRSDMRVVSQGYPVATWCTTLLSAGLILDAVLEPPALPRQKLAEAPYRADAWEAIHRQLRRFPSTLILRAHRPQTAKANVSRRDGSWL